MHEAKKAFDGSSFSSVNRSCCFVSYWSVSHLVNCIFLSFGLFPGQMMQFKMIFHDTFHFLSHFMQQRSHSLKRKQQKLTELLIICVSFHYHCVSSCAVHVHSPASVKKCVYLRVTWFVCPSRCLRATAVTGEHTGMTVDKQLISNQNKTPELEKRSLFHSDTHTRTHTHAHTHTHTRPVCFPMSQSASWALWESAVTDVECI